MIVPFLIGGGKEVSHKDSTDNLKGTALEIYRYMLRTSKPMGIREIQRALKLSSPSVAQYHLAKLEQVGLVRKEMGDYVINRVVLESCIKISRFLVPKYLFYVVLASVFLIIELTVLRPDVLYREYYYSVMGTTLFLSIFCYETVKVLRKGSL
jgi:DNA-binding transcriptional ArsR family regulator